MQLKKRRRTGRDGIAPILRYAIFALRDKCEFRACKNIQSRAL
jgi:hypothetical protein